MEGVDGNNYFSTGTWKLIGTSFSTTITATATSAVTKGTVQNLTATYGKSAGSLTSVFGKMRWVMRPEHSR